MGDIEGFDWDAANVGHILRHAVTPLEVEEVAGRPHVTIPAVTGYEMNAAERRNYAPQND